MSDFLGVEIYKTLVSPIRLGEIIFKSDSSIQIAKSDEAGGGFAFITYSIRIKNGTDIKVFEENGPGCKETLITRFIRENLGVLFEKVNI